MWRLMTPPERNLLTVVLTRASGGQRLIAQLDGVRVQNMNDGGMGSLKFEPTDSNSQRLGKTIAEAQFVDEDGITVSVAVNLDQYGNLYELDLWKADFSPLKRWPNIEEVIVTKQGE